MSYYAKRFFGQQGIVTDGLKLWLDASNPLSYPGTGTLWRDLSGNGNNGTMINGVTYNAANGGVMSFDGVNDHIIIPHSTTLKPANQITICAWVNASNLTNHRYHTIYRKEDGDNRHLFAFQEYGKILSFGINIGGRYGELDASIITADYINKWVYVAATYDGFVASVYKNGEVIGIRYNSGLINTTGLSNVHIGSNSGSSEFFTGLISGVLLYDRALTTEEMAQNYNASKSKYGL